MYSREIRSREILKRVKHYPLRFKTMISREWKVVNGIKLGSFLKKRVSRELIIMGKIRRRKRLSLGSRKVLSGV